VDQHRPAAAAVAGTGATRVRPARLLAWLLLGLYGVFTAVALLLQGLAGIPEDTSGLAGVAVISAAILVWSFAGSLIAARRPSHPIGWLLAGIALVRAIYECAFGYAAYGLVAHPGSLPAALAVALLLYRPLEPLTLLGPALVFLLFPDGRLPSRRWRPLAWAGVAAAAVLALGWIVDPDPIPALRIHNPLQAGPALQTILDPLWVVAFVLLVVAALAAATSSWLRLHHARGQARQQLKWFAYATAFLPVGFGLLIFGRSATTEWIGGALVLVGSVGLPLAVAVAIFRYRLYDIDRIISRTLAYGLLTLLLGSGYAGVVLGLGQLLGRHSSLVVAGATLAVAAVFQPARHRIQELVDRRFNRRRYDAAQTIAAFSARLRQQVDLDTLTAELLAVVDQTMQPTVVSLWLRPSVGMPRTRAVLEHSPRHPSGQ
jgi:MFS family permease